MITKTIKPPKSMTNKRYPAFIRDHSGIKKSTKIVKNFKGIGLPDFSENYTHKSDISLTAYVALLKKLLISYTDHWSFNDYFHQFFSSSQEILMESELLKLSKLITRSSIKKNGKLVIPCSLRIPNFYKDKIVRYNEGSSILTILNAFARDLMNGIRVKSVKQDVEDLIKKGVDLELSWNKSLKIVFSSHPWDIATMSMRGITSCQAWGKTHQTHLVGSIIDPNMAIIYLTDGEIHGKYGTRMLARAVIRAVAPSKKYDEGGIYLKDVSPEEKKKRVLYVEGSYGHFSPITVQSPVYDDIFKKILAEKFRSEENYWDPKETYRYGIPLTPQVKKLSSKYLSYRDSGIEYISMK